MKYIRLIFICLFVFVNSNAQIASFNHFPSLRPTHVLDEYLTDISFALSMRVLVSDYEGPLIRLRRASDDAEQDFGWSDNDIVDITAINAWRGGSDVFITTWYDQSGLGRNAIQATQNNQPKFFPDAALPYFQGDGIDDYLTVDTPNGIQDVTNSGNEGSILAVMTATNKAQSTFGVIINNGQGSNRWSSQVNYTFDNGTTGFFYFDPGICCNSGRAFLNSANTNLWKQYTFIKRSTTFLVRINSTQFINATYTRGRCTLTLDFAIGWATGNINDFATNRFNEFVMYRADISPQLMGELEQDAISFWGIL